MLKFGIIGMNDGNGHPYSFTAAFNGFNAEALAEKCSFPIIREYLTAHHRNREFIPDARVTHIWTQDKEISQQIADVSNIPHVADSITELVSEVDGIIFARDDIWNHWEMAKEIFASGKPVYMDKLLAHNVEDLQKFITVTGENYPLLTASSYQFAPNVKCAAETMPLTELRTVHGASPVIWVRYAPHLLGALFAICGNDVISVQNCGADKEDTVCLTFANGVQAVLQVFEKMALPLELKFFFNAPHAPVTVAYTDPGLGSYFLSIVEMMRAFTEMAKSGKKVVSFSDTLKTNAIVLAGIRSREENGRKIYADEFMEYTKI